jgi:hypothetical protein
MAANRHDSRDAILVRFDAGEITREEADAEAAAVGFTSTERAPDFVGVDCCKLARWSMPQLMAWVIYRSSERVVALAEEHRTQTLLWNETGTRLQRPNRMSLFDVVEAAVSRDESEGRAHFALRARQELVAQFLEGALTAYGIQPGHSEHSTIPRTAWGTIDLFDLPCSQFEPEEIGRESERMPRYSDVYVVPEEVLTLYPRSALQRPQTDPEPSRGTSDDEARGPQTDLEPSQGASDDEARRIIREAIAANGGFISQKEGAEIVRGELPVSIRHEPCA